MPSPNCLEAGSSAPSHATGAALLLVTEATGAGPKGSRTVAMLPRAYSSAEIIVWK